jgi:endonuclease/exonuclease/phosphatase family metal-dependent hydrolase
MNHRIFAALLIAAIGCSGDKDGEGEGEPQPVSLELVTYNAGLAVGFVPGADSRTPLVAEAVGALEADVVCLQEVWLPDQIAAIDAAAAGNYPHRFAPAPQQSSDASCDVGELDNLVGCIADTCAEACVDEVVDCVFGGCPFQFVGLPKDCMRCAMANVGEEPAAVASVCETDPVEFAYGGSFGTMLLSKHPFVGDVTEHVFDSTSNRRSLLQAELDLGDGKTATVMCTHLTAVFTTIPYPRDEGNWEPEQLAQVEEINAIAEGIDGPVLLLGDLNTGFGGEGLQPEAAANIQMLVDAGWASPYRTLDGRCTFCSDNPLIIGADDDDNRLIDHVLLKGPVEATAATRILDQTVSADSCAYDLSTSALSDHYGVSVTVEL